MKRDNRGFSYLELVVVITIIAVMAMMVTISVGTLNRNEVLRTSEKLETMVNKARVNAMAKGSALYGGGGTGWINIAEYGGAYYASVGKRSTDPEDVKKNGEKIGSAKLSIYVAGKRVGDDAFGDGDLVRHLGFKQSTGGIFAGAGTCSFLVKNDKMSTVFTVNGTTGRITRD